MEQEKIGRFIAQLRKEKGLTQKSLALKINITDKAVSKWECGYCLPDNSVMPKLCEELGITVNELLSGERLSTDDYNKKAEENIMNLMDENNKTGRSNRAHYMLNIVLGAVVIIYIIVSFAINSNVNITRFLDAVGFLEVAAITMLMVILAGRLGSFCDIVRLNIRKCDDADRVRRAVETADFTIKSLFMAGGISACIFFVTLMAKLSDASSIGPNLAVIVLGILYSFILAGTVLVLKERLLSR